MTPSAHDAWTSLDLKRDPSAQKKREEIRELTDFGGEKKKKKISADDPGKPQLSGSPLDSRIPFGEPELPRSGVGSFSSTDASDSPPPQTRSLDFFFSSQSSGSARSSSPEA
ncbi:hypothetical protein CDL15_Pgr028971 [Punica granatum]|uniref:Uncharacterized protein n=1 Tax=Punica granatum TaxID=22663 RepID=A0A218Y543_PUNGR|nr:hypothetical protein CDL15_Pgr028971 [Punica granatum]PKI59345.1 hypothetical protein CRG98_020261 [Punica granatum]